MATEFQPNPPRHPTLISDDHRLLDNEEDEAGPEQGGGLDIEIQDCRQGSPVPLGVGRIEDTLIYGDDDEVQVELSEDGIRAMNLTITSPNRGPCNPLATQTASPNSSRPATLRNSSPTAMAKE